MRVFFANFARKTARLVGSPWAFFLAIVALVAWALSGPLFGFSDTWQLIINTGTTILTFLIVFLIQNTQNRDSEAIQVKLDELIRVTQKARNSLLDIEDSAEDELDKIRDDFAQERQRDRDLEKTKNLGERRN